MKLLIDMNLSPKWREVLQEAEIEAQHWSAVGPASASDSVILDHARRGGWVVFTQDLDFAQLLFETSEAGPSIILLRVRDELARETQLRLVSLVRVISAELMSGALVILDDQKARLRRLPITAGKGAGRGGKVASSE